MPDKPDVATISFTEKREFASWKDQTGILKEMVPEAIHPYFHPSTADTGTCLLSQCFHSPCVHALKNYLKRNFEYLRWKTKKRYGQRNQSQAVTKAANRYLVIAGGWMIRPHQQQQDHH